VRIASLDDHPAAILQLDGVHGEDRSIPSPDSAGCFMAMLTLSRSACSMVRVPDPMQKPRPVAWGT
jgi:hypothetical protein